MAKPRTQPTWLPGLLTNLATVSGVGYVALAYSLSRWLTRPTHRKIASTPADYGLAWEPLSCRTSDGLHLNGWVVNPPAPRATVTLFHGLRNTREQTLTRTAFLAAAGYRCVAFDHRAHGESHGKRSSFGFHEFRDVIAILDLVADRWRDQPRAALGMSMGAAALCYAADHVRGLDAIILESLYHDIASAFRNRLSAEFPPTVKRLSRGVLWVTERRLGLRVSQLAPIEHIGKLAPSPVLLLTGAEDSHALPSEAQQLFERCQPPCEFMLVPRAGHTDVCETGGLAYQTSVLSFLERHLFGSSGPVSADWSCAIPPHCL